MIRIVLLGRGGQLGDAVLTRLTNLPDMGEVIALGRTELDLSDVDQIAAKIAPYQPDWIINTAAYTAVDRAETEGDVAHRVNGEAPGQLAAVAQVVGARLIHISTDYVFDGKQGQPWQETDVPHPVNVYGQTKLAGERAVQAALPDRHVIVRTAWVYGGQGKGNFVKTMLRLGQQQSTLRVVQDQVGSPTWTEDLAQVLVTLVRLGESVPAGIYHYTNSGVASWYDFAIAIFAEAHALGYPLKVNHVEPIPSTDYPTPAQRPAYSVLNCHKLTTLLGQAAPHWRASLQTMLRNYLKELRL